MRAATNSNSCRVVLSSLFSGEFWGKDSKMWGHFDTAAVAVEAVVGIILMY